MAITQETAKKHEKDYAILCCRLEGGTEIEPSHIEDPNLIPDFEDSGLVTIPEDCLRIGQVIGGKLTKTVNSLTPLSPDLVEGIKYMELDSTEEISKQESKEEFKQDFESPVSQSSPGIIKIHIGEGKDINIEIPYPQTSDIITSKEDIQTQEVSKDIKSKENRIKKLKRKHFKIDNVDFSETTKIEGNTLYIRENIVEDAIKSQELVVNIKLDIITKDKYNEESNTIMDIQPIATKEEGLLGEGITRLIDGVVIMITGTDEDGVQIGEFGSSEGVMGENIMWNRPGSPDIGDIIIRADVIIEQGKGMERPGPMAAHKATDYITREIRQALRNAEDSLSVLEDELVHERRPGRKKVVIVKEIMGQGAMHDNYIMPDEPVGVIGAKANVDLGNVPIIVSPLQVLDGCIHALTCIGPASKETSRHYFREPLVLKALEDEELDLVSIIFVGSPQANTDKFYVSNLLGRAVESMDVDGAIVTTEGFGNNHIDFASHIEEIGKRGIPVVGMTFAAEQGQLVVGNKYMDAMIDLNKSEKGIENEILSNNCLCEEDAIRALYMLKAKMNGKEIIKAERKYNHNVKENNIKLIEKAMDLSIERVKNENK